MKNPRKTHFKKDSFFFQIKKESARRKQFCSFTQKIIHITQ